MDNKPALRQIGVGEVLWQIAGKLLVTNASDDIVASVESKQVCAGHEAGCESLIYAMRTVHEEQSGEAIRLVDASKHI